MNDRSLWYLARGAAAASRAVILVIGVVAALANVAAAQTTGVISGIVIDVRSRQPVKDATINILDTRFGALTGADGRYRIAGVTSGSRTVVARRIGYGTARHVITVSGDQTVNFDLEQAALSLDEVVITGTAGGELRRAVGNSVSTIDAVEAIDKSGAQSISSLIGARAPGVSIAPSTSRLGAGPAIQIRGRNSIGLDNSPIVFVDGLRVNNATNAGPVSPSGRLGGQNSNVAGRLNDLTPEDIESIEIIKGPAAATIYGTEAANGVIQIITKRGSSGARPQISATVEDGLIFMQDAAGRTPTNYMKEAGTGTITPWNGVQQEIDRGTPIYKNGQTRKYIGSASGGRDTWGYYTSATYQNDLGVEPNNTLRQGSFRGNLNLQISPTLDLASSLGYSSVSVHLGADVGASALLGAIVGHKFLFPNARGFYPNYTPDIPQSLYDNAQGVRRFLGSTTLTHRPAEWFSQHLTVGVDETGDDSRAIERFTADPATVALIGAAAAGGSIGQTLRHSTIVSTDYAANVKRQLTSKISSSSSVGGQFFRTEQNASFLGGTSFPGYGVELVSAASSPVTATQSQTLNTTIGAYGQQQFGWNERLYLTAGLRVDNHSAFGDKLKWVTYPKLSGTWIISEEPFWRANSFISSLRLRSAYGQSGRPPAAFSALKTYSPASGPANANAVTPNSRGNANLKPERGSEVEIGFDAQLFSRLSVDFTYYNKKTTDVIVNQPVAPSSGFYTAVPVNLGRVDNHGLELLASFQAVARRNFAWDLSANIGTNGDEIKDLGGIGGVVLNAGQTNVVGYPIGGIWTKKVVSADRDPATGLALTSSVLCDGGAGKPAIACASAPFVFIGTPTPKMSGSFANTFTLFNSLRLYALVDTKRGNRVYNANEQLRCTGAIGAQLCRASYYPLEFEPVYLAERVGTAAAQGITDQYYQDATFAKLREISATWTIPARFARGYQSASVTVSGRDLHTWTDYAGIDPEVNVNNIATSANTQDQAVTPPLSRLFVSFNFKF